MIRFSVSGMSCAACSSRVEKAVKQVKGVTSCAVNLLTGDMGVEGDVSPEEIIKAVENAGYGATLKSGEEKGKVQQRSPSAESDRQTRALVVRLIASVAFLLPLMYLSMGHTMWGWKLPSALEGNHLAVGMLQMLFAGAVMVINQKFFINGAKGLARLSPNMDSLVALGSAASFGWSAWTLLKMTSAQNSGDMQAVMDGMMDLYFESAAMILTLITVGKLLESVSKGKTTNALKGLMALAPKTACVVRDGKEVVIEAKDVVKGDIFIVRPGESIPADGVVSDGESAVNEAALTGESLPVDKTKGDRVSAGTVNSSGLLRCEAVKVGEDTALSQIIKLVEETAATKAPIARLADKVSGVFVPVVIGIAVLTAAVWLLAGREAGFALARGISVLVISCPCALGLATPVAIMVGNGVGARQGILFKSSAALEQAGKVKVIALDKTGTITEGQPAITDLLPAEGVAEEELLAKAAALEAGSEHPLAAAVMKKAEERGIKHKQAEKFEVLAGNGLRAQLDGSELLGGSVRFVSANVKVPKEAEKASGELAEQGKTPVMFAQGGKYLGMAAVSDVIREDSAQAVSELKEMGIQVVMLTGDDRRTAERIGSQAGVDKVIAQVLPEEKQSAVESLQGSGGVAMVGDGINDAPALTAADVGIAIGAGTDIAIDSADVVLMKSRLGDVPAAIRLSRATLRNIRQNLFWAFFYNVIGIPLAAGVWIPIFGWTLDPMYGAAAMSLSSFFVVTNALRLNFAKIRRTGKGKAEAEGEKVYKIKGMMCSHCEGRIKEALEGLEFVSSAQADHISGTVRVKLSSAPDVKQVKQAVKAAGYKFIS